MASVRARVRAQWGRKDGGLKHNKKLDFAAGAATKNRRVTSQHLSLEYTRMILDEVINEVVEGTEDEAGGASQIMKNEGENDKEKPSLTDSEDDEEQEDEAAQNKKNEALTTSYREQVYQIEYRISHLFQIHEI